MFQPVGKPVETSGITPRHVTCVEPAIRKVRPCRHLILPISGQDIVAPHPDFANRAISNIASIRTNKPDRIVTPRPANGTNGLKGNVSCLVNGGWRGFSRAIDLHHRNLPIMHRPDQRHRYVGRANGKQPHAGKIGFGPIFMRDHGA